MKLYKHTPLLIFALCLFACNRKEEGKPADAKTGGGNNAPVMAEGYLVQERSLAQDIEVAGTLMPFEQTEIRSEISGRVTGIYFREGANVGSGQVLVKLFDGDLQAQFRKLAVQLKIARKTEERQQELLKINGISQQDYDLSVLQVSNIQADMEILQAAISKTAIRAPYSGKMGLRNISMGAVINPQTIVSTLSQVGQLKLEFTVPERYAATMQPGKTIALKTEANLNDRLATIIATENEVDDATRTLRVKAAVQGASNGLTAGAYASVQVDLGSKSNALMVPTQSIIPQARNKQVIVIKNGKPIFTPVTLGVRDSSKVEVTSGLKLGDTVLMTGLLFVRPASNVKVTKVNL
jgi:membrane fusion protein, multidrug efflux system